MMRRVLYATLVAAASTLTASNLWAHGGQFRGPGGAVPPTLREPTDPTPPPPPPPTSGPPITPPPTVTPGVTPPSAPPPVTPPTNTPPPQTGDLPSAGPGGKKSQLSFESWMFWYENNKEDLENLKSAIYTLSSSESPLSVLTGQGREGGGQKSGNTQSTASKVDPIILPALKWAMDHGNAGHQDVESASYIAMAKVAKLPEHIELIMKGLDFKNKDLDQVTLESAALSLGLLRRQEPARQFAASELDKVRAFLFTIIENDKDYATGTRAFAAMSLGMLGDQPTGSGDYANDVDQAQRATTAHIWDLLNQHHKDDNIPVALLIGLGLQPKNSLGDGMEQGLADATLKGRLGKVDCSREVRAYTALALGRVGGPSIAVKALQSAVASRQLDPQIQRSVAIGLGLLGRLVPVEARLEIAKGLREAVEKASDNSVRNFALISLAYLVNRDIEEGRTDVLEAGKVGEFLLQQCTDGNPIQRPFGALALGLVARKLGESNRIETYNVFKQKALLAMRDGASTQKLDKRNRAGFCVALGIAQDIYYRKPLQAIVSDTKEDKELRGYAAIALGLIGKGAADEVVQALRAALDERSEEMRQQVATALGLLKDNGAVPKLIQALQEAESQNLKGQIVLALAKIGDARAVEPLVELLKDRKQGDITRALACAGLGVVADLEMIPSLSRISKDINYRASVFYVNEVLSIL